MPDIRDSKKLRVLYLQLIPVILITAGPKMFMVNVLFCSSEKNTSETYKTYLAIETSLNNALTRGKLQRKRHGDNVNFTCKV